MNGQKYAVAFGALVPPLKEQLRGYGIKAGRVRVFQKVHDAILMCWFQNVLTDAEKNRAFDRLFKSIDKAIKENKKGKKK